MKRRLRRNLVRVVVGLLLGSIGVILAAQMAGFGCVRRPDAMEIAAPVSNADLMEGSWIGAWASNQRDMGGELRCQIKKLEPDLYEATFDAVFGGMFNNHSVVKLRIGDKSDGWRFSGEEDLGLLKGGVYRYDGRSDGVEFFCTYDSKYDKGTFRMRRAQPATRPAGK